MKDKKYIKFKLTNNPATCNVLVNDTPLGGVTGVSLTIQAGEYAPRFVIYGFTNPIKPEQVVVLEGYVVSPEDYQLLREIREKQRDALFTITNLGDDSC